MLVYSLTAASTAYRSSVQAPGAKPQNVARSVTCRRADRTLGGTSAAHAMVVAPIVFGAVSGRASTTPTGAPRTARVESASAK